MNQGDIIRNEAEADNVFNKYFVSMVPKMGITINKNFLSSRDTSDDPLEKIIRKYKNHSNITYINKHMKNSEFTFIF